MTSCSATKLDIGHGIEAEIRSIDGEIEGVYYEHACLNGQMSPGWVPLTGLMAWTIVKREPLTLSPSLLCPLCGHHGFIREGRWVPA